MSAYYENKGLMRAWRALGFSLQGIRQCFKYESAFRQEVALSFVIIPLGIWLGEGAVEQVLLVGSWVLVMILELLNSAVEAVVDRIGPEQHELSGRAKDIGSAAVLAGVVLAVFVWAMLLLPRYV